MKDYLSSREREEFFKVYAAWQATDGVIERTADKQRKEILADLKRGKSFLGRAIQTWVDPLDRKARETILKRARGLNVMVASDLSLKRAQVEYLQHMKRVREEAYATDGKDYVCDLAEITMSAMCRRCNGQPKAHCVVYEALHALSIEPWDVQHPHCEYAGSGNV